MLWKLFYEFFKIGLFTFGGGYAMIAQVRETVVEKRHWLEEEELLQIITIAESTPGPIAINMATYVGYKKGGVPGSALATFGNVLPSLIIIFCISLFLDRAMLNPIVQAAFVGVKCAVAFLILKAGLGLAKKLEKKPLPLITFGAVLGLMVTLDILSLSFSSLILILVGGAVGIFAYALLQGKRREGEK